MAPALTLRNDSLTVRVSRSGAAIIDARTADGRPFLRPSRSAPGAFDVRQSACFPLVPIGNRVAGNAFTFGGLRHAFQPNTDEALYIHGDGWLDEWQSAAGALDTGEVSLTFEQPAVPGSPYIYRAAQLIALDGRTLHLRLSVENTGNVAMPFGLGFHPFFPRTPRTTLQAPAGDWWTEATDHLPSVRRPAPADVDFGIPKKLPPYWLNNCFEGWSGHARIDWPEIGLGVCLVADEALSRYMLYAPDDGQSFFCFEPMSHTPNALAAVETDPKGLRVLVPGEVFNAGFSITVFERSDTDD